MRIIKKKILDSFHTHTHASYLWPLNDNYLSNKKKNIQKKNLWVDQNQTTTTKHIMIKQRIEMVPKKKQKKLQCQNRNEEKKTNKLSASTTTTTKVDFPPHTHKHYQWMISIDSSKIL